MFARQVAVAGSQCRCRSHGNRMLHHIADVANVEARTPATMQWYLQHGCHLVSTRFPASFPPTVVTQTP